MKKNSSVLDTMLFDKQSSFRTVHSEGIKKANVIYNSQKFQEMGENYTNSR